MPTTPVFGDVFGYVGMVKVFGEGKAKHMAQTYRHIRISREIEINLQSIEQNSAPAAQNGGTCGRSKKIFRCQRTGVCKYNLFTHTDGKSVQTVVYLLCGNAAVFKLVLYIRITDDRTRNQLREEGYE